MWGRKRAPRIDTLVGKRSIVEGDVRFAGGLHVEGRIKGNIIAEPQADSILIVSTSGVVEGEVHVANIVLHGTINGDVDASEALNLSARAHVEGDVYYNMLEMAVGATVNGNLVHHQADNEPDEPETVPTEDNQNSASP